MFCRKRLKEQEIKIAILRHEVDFLRRVIEWAEKELDCTNMSEKYFAAKMLDAMNQPNALLERLRGKQEKQGE